MEVKEKKEEVRNIKIAAVMTCGRWGCVRSLLQITNALQGMGIPLIYTQGVFWGQCLTRAVEESMDNLDYILTIDWDSMLTANDIRQLVFDGVGKNFDAIIALQVRRGGQLPLISFGASGEALFPRGAIIPIATGHFGLSLFKAEIFKGLKKPWFLATASDEGRWNTDSNKVDEDIYFWHNFKESGFQAYCHTGVKIGHLEEMVTCYDDELNVQYVYPQEWLEQQNKVKNEELEKRVRANDEQEATEGEVGNPSGSNDPSH